MIKFIYKDLLSMYKKILRLSFPQVKRVGNPSVKPTERFRTSRNDKYMAKYLVFMQTLNNQTGVSIIATVLTLLILSVFGAVVVSLVTTGSGIGLQEEQGVQAFYIAEGGLEKALIFLRDGGRCQDISGEPTLTGIPLGSGSFAVMATRYRPLPSARLLNNITAAATSIQSNTANLIAAGYAPSGRIYIQNDPPPGTEAINYASVSGDTLLNCTRGVDGTVASAHNANRRIVQDQCDILSTGTITASLNPFAGVQRQARISVQQ